MNQIPNIEEEFANKLSSSIRYSSGKGQYDAFPDCQDAYLDGVETAIAMMYIDLTGTPKSEGMLAKFLHHQLQKAREEALEREKQLKQVHMMELDAISCMSLEQYVAWRDYRKQRPHHSELDQDTELLNSVKEDWDKQAKNAMNGLDQDVSK